LVARKDLSGKKLNKESDDEYTAGTAKGSKHPFGTNNPVGSGNDLFFMRELSRKGAQ
jgi:hypothetical protein